MSLESKTNMNTEESQDGLNDVINFQKTIDDSCNFYNSDNEHSNQRKTIVSKEKILESNVKNICRNYLSMPQFKGLKEHGIQSTTFFCYYFCTVLSPRNRVRNIYSDYQLQLLHFFWTSCVPIFFKEFGTLTSNVAIFGDETKNCLTLSMIKKFINELHSDQLRDLMTHFDINSDRIRYIFSNCCSQYHYQTNINALNVKLEVESNLQSIRKRKIAELEKINVGEAKPKGSAAREYSKTAHPWEQRIVDDALEKKN